MDNLGKFFFKKKILITGHTGFKGSWLTSILLHYGSKVIGFSKKDQKKYFYEKFVDYKKVNNIYGDILDIRFLRKKINEHRPEIIFHLAAQSLVIEGYKNPYKTFLDNSNGVLNILEIVRKTNFVKSLIIATSDKCYKIKKKKIFKENDELGGLDPYSSSKAAAEIIFNSYLNLKYRNKVGLATVRAGNVIGGGDFSKNRLIPDCFRSMKTKKIILRNPKAIRPWQHVMDVCRGYLILSKKLYLKPRLFSGSWNFGPKKNDLNVLNLVRFFKKSSSKKFKIKIVNNNKFKETTILKLNSQKSEKKLKWQNLINSKLMVRYTVDWYNEFLKNKLGLKITNKQINNFFK
jgi:CDP-glucose 4,6-dehydratase